jgi:ribosomal protein L37AE/L43A
MDVRMVIGTFFAPLPTWAAAIAKVAWGAWLRIWRSLGRQKLVKGLSGVSYVRINKASTVRLKCPKCHKSSDFTIERLKGNPKCGLCNDIFDGGPFMQNLKEQLLKAVQRI